VLQLELVLSGSSAWTRACASDAISPLGVTEAAFVKPVELGSVASGNSTLARSYSSAPCCEVEGKEPSSAVVSAWPVESLTLPAALVRVDFARHTAVFGVRARFGLLTREVVAGRDDGVSWKTNTDSRIPVFSEDAVRCGKYPWAIFRYFVSKEQLFVLYLHRSSRFNDPEGPSTWIASGQW
jgi:hypothetical protein